MTGLYIKLLLYPGVVYLSDYFLTHIHFVASYQPVLVGLVVAIAAYYIELFLLSPKTLLINMLLEFLLSFTLIYISTAFFPGSYISLYGALITAAFLSLTEIIQHHWLVENHTI